MKNKNIGIGVILILLGAFWMLENLGFITWSMWEGIFDLWPLILVVVGVNMIFKNKSYVRMVTWILFFAALVTYGFFQEQRNEKFQLGNDGIVQIIKETEAVKGKLDLDLGAGNLEVGGTKVFLVDARVPNPYVKNKVEAQDGGKSVDVQFKEGNHKILKFGKEINYRFHLNEEMVWDLDIDMGASNGTLDLSRLNIKDLDIEAGAANLKLIFGENIEDANVKIDTGASSIDMIIPKAIGTRIKLDSAIKNSNLKSLNWDYDQGYYQSPNYEDAEKKINVDIDMGAGTLDVRVE